MNINSKIFQNSIWSVVNQILSIMVAFFLTLMFGRIYGPSILGSYSSSQALVGILALLTNFGIPTILSREVANKPNKINFLLSSSLSIKIMFSFPLLILLTFLITFFLGYTQFDIKISILTSIYLTLTNILTYLELSMKSIHRNDIFLKVNIFYKFIILLSTSILLFLSFDLVTIIFAQSIISFFTLLFTITHISHLTGHLAISYNYKVYKTFILITSPFVLASAAEFVNLKIDSLFINQILGLEKTGYYNAAYNIYLGATVIPLALIQVYFPNFIERNKISVILSKRLFHKYFINLFLYSIFTGIFFYIFGDFIVEVLFNKNFLESKLVLKILMGGLFIIVLNRLVNYTLVALKENKYYLRITLAGTIINIVLNAFLIQYFGIKGAAFSTLLTEALILFLGLRKLYKKEYFGIKAL
jgi:O-antigen/teichoic acid export membrane protein